MEKSAVIFDEIYNIGGSRSLPNLEVVRRILQATGKVLLTRKLTGIFRITSASCRRTTG